MTPDLFEIPPFLRRGTPENIQAIANGAAIIAARKPRVARRKTSASWANTGYREPIKKYRCADSTYHILHSLGWTDKVINRLSANAANQYADGGVKMQPIHEVQK
jgi:hypothetical protein